MHRRLEQRDEVAEPFSGEGVDVAHERLEVDQVVVGLHARLSHLLAQAVERREVGALGDLRRATVVWRFDSCYRISAHKNGWRVLARLAGSRGRSGRGAPKRGLPGEVEGR